MKKKTIIIICIAVAVIALIVVKIVYDKISAKKAEEERQERYAYTVQYITDNLENFEKMCEYDLEHCDDYKSIDASKTCYHLPRSGDPYSRERRALFTELGLELDGFTDAWIYPDDNMIKFWDHGGYCMQLIYVKDGDIENGDSLDRIGEHFYTYYYYVGQPRG